MRNICGFPKAISGRDSAAKQIEPHYSTLRGMRTAEKKLLLVMSHLTGQIPASRKRRKVFSSFPLIFFTCPSSYVTFSLPPLHLNVAVIPTSPSLGICDVPHPLLHSTWRWFYPTTIACHFPPLPAALAGCRVSQQRQYDKRAGRIRATDCCQIK